MSFDFHLFLVAVDAVTASRERFDPADSDLTTNVDNLVQNYMFQISHGDEVNAVCLLLTREVFILSVEFFKITYWSCRGLSEKH